MGARGERRLGALLFAVLEFDMTLADPTVTFKVIKNPQKRTSSLGAGVTITETTVRRSELRN